LALLGAVALLLALGGCGRKGGLDLPPVASGSQPAYAAPASAPVAPQLSPLGSSFDPSVPDEKPTAAPGVKKRIILDPILD
jgi:predicted small lipoprotein YifL